MSEETEADRKLRENLKLIRTLGRKTKRNTEKLHETRQQQIAHGEAIKRLEHQVALLFQELHKARAIKT